MLDTWTIKKTEEQGTSNRSLTAKRGDEQTVVWVGDIPIGGSDVVVMAGP